MKYKISCLLEELDSYIIVTNVLVETNHNLSIKRVLPRGRNLYK